MLTQIENFCPKGEIFDTHAHYNDKSFSNEENLFGQLKQFGVMGGIISGCDINSIQKAISLVKDEQNWYVAAGFHPENLPDAISKIDGIVPFLSNKKVVAVGEIGLDYYWNSFDHNYQKDCFMRQIKIAKEHNLPIIVHNRDAHCDILEILKATKPSGVVHCFSGSAETAKEIIKLGMYIGIGGTLTFKGARKTIEVVNSIPLERILLETDAPYLTPSPYRGKQNHSGMIAFVAQKIAEIKNTDTSSVLKICKQNAYRLFSLSN